MRPIAGFAGPSLPQLLPLKHPPHHSKKGVSVTVATINDDYTDRVSNLDNVKKKASVLLVQEAKNTRVRDVLGDRFGVHQDFAHKDKAGAAVAWNRKDVDVMDSGYAVGVRPNGHKLLTRWINYNDMKIDGQKVRMISVHRPPPRDSALWPEFNRNLAEFIKKTNGPVIVGMDANHSDPVKMEKATGLRWVAPKGSIDGFLVSDTVHVESMQRLPRGPSDHNPVVAKFRIRPAHEKTIFQPSGPR